MKCNPAVFLDKDGTLVPDIPYNVRPERITLVAGASVALPKLVRAGFQLVVISNQSGVARGMFKESALTAVESRIRQLLHEIKVPLRAFYYCPHHPDGKIAKYSIRCECRKPQPGLLLRAAEELNIPLEYSWMIGDILDDVEAAHRACCRAALLLNGGETLWEMSALRRPEVVATDLAVAADKIVGSACRSPQHDSAKLALRSVYV
jgi:D,D-heptose 1,7-bisphosphate phosphatase